MMRLKWLNGFAHSHVNSHILRHNFKTTDSWSYRKTTVAQNAAKFNAGSDRKDNHSFMCMDLNSCRPIRVPLLTLVHHRNHLPLLMHMSIRTGPRGNGRWWSGISNHVFFYIMGTTRFVTLGYLLGEEIPPGWGRRQAGGGVWWAMFCWEILSPAFIWTLLWNVPST